ncbi:MAG: hypothetical protein KC493_03380 [Bacteriovoracaceae bacterium]|nr:hypothetical protein [Bacteriovoracaceae bacterium]
MEKMFNHEILRLNKSLLFQDDENSFYKINNENLHQFSRKKIVEIFCTELKYLLEIDDLVELVKRIDSLEYHLETLREENEKNVPNLDDFFRVLSPVLMRAIVENIETNKGREALHQGFQESIRISIEEEIHIWQEKLL